MNSRRKTKSDQWAGRTLTSSKKAPNITIHAVPQKNRSTSLFVDGSSAGRTIPLLIDTVATKSIVRPDVLQRLVKLGPTAIQLRTATGATISTRGVARLMVGIGSQKHEHDVLVADISDDFILGMDLLRRFKFVLDLKEGVLKAGAEKLPLGSCEDSGCNVLLTDDVTLTGQSERVVEADLDGDIRTGCVRIIEQEDSQWRADGKDTR